MSRTHTGPTLDALMKGGLPCLPGQGNYGVQSPFHPQDYLDSYITTEDVASLLHVTVNGAQTLIRNGEIRASFIGRRWLTTRANVDAYLQAHAQGGPEDE